MQYITVAEAAGRWELTVRRVQDLCRTHKIHGAVRWGRDWMIPADAQRPVDRRKKQVEEEVKADSAQLHRKNPAIILSNLYHRPGSADQVAFTLEDRPVGAALFRGLLAMLRGQVPEAKAVAKTLLEGECGHDLQIGCGLILANCAIFQGRPEDWLEACRIIQEAPCRDTRDRQAIDFWVAAAASELREIKSFPVWFTRGSFDVLPGDSFPSARFFYLRYLYLRGQEYAMGHYGQPDFQNNMRYFGYVAEPLIAQNKKEGALVSEVYTRLICACAYHDLGNDPLATHHLDIALELALPDRLYMPLAEYRRQLDFLMDERLRQMDPEAASQVKALNQKFLEGWTALQTAARGLTISNTLTTREREVAKLAAFGLSNKEIADRLNISVNTVKQSLRTAMDKTGALRRNELGRYI